MVKKSILEREKKRRILVKEHKSERTKLLINLKKVIGFTKKLKVAEQIQKFPRDSAFVRLRNRCWKTGRARGYYRYFGICRNILRQMALECYLPGIIKSSW